MDNFELIIGKILRIGVIFSFMLVLTGGVFYLFQHGFEIVHLQTFSQETARLTSVNNIFLSALQFSAIGLIQLGLLILVLIQVLRVALTTWMFYHYRENILLLSSLFILFVLIYSLFFFNVA